MVINLIIKSLDEKVDKIKELDILMKEIDASEGVFGYNFLIVVHFSIG